MDFFTLDFDRVSLNLEIAFRIVAKKDLFYRMYSKPVSANKVKKWDRVQSAT
jgi:hypothetical protein